MRNVAETNSAERVKAIIIRPSILRAANVLPAAMPTATSLRTCRWRGAGAGLGSSYTPPSPLATALRCSPFSLNSVDLDQHIPPEQALQEGRLSHDRQPLVRQSDTGGRTCRCQRIRIAQATPAAVAMANTVQWRVPFRSLTEDPSRWSSRPDQRQHVGPGPRLILPEDGLDAKLAPLRDHTQALWQRTSVSPSGTMRSCEGGIGVVQSLLGVPSPGACLATPAGNRSDLGGPATAGRSLDSLTSGP
jgi:hypothetical protein